MKVIIYTLVYHKIKINCKGWVKRTYNRINGKSIIEYQLDWITTLDITDIIIVIGLEHESKKRIK